MRDAPDPEIMAIFSEVCKDNGRTLSNLSNNVLKIKMGFPIERGAVGRVIAFNRTRGNVLGDRIGPARTFLERARGLLGRRSLAEGDGLWISPCSCVHTLGMSFPIDVLFLDGNGRVLGLYSNLQRTRITRFFSKAAGALELPAGTIQRTDTARGDLVEFREEGMR